LNFREELRGIKRANNAKDVDWNKVANSITLETTTKPAAVKINVNESLNKIKPTTVTITQAPPLKNGTI